VDRYFPESAFTRSIFGGHFDSYGVGFFDLVPSPTSRTHFGFGVDSLSLANSSNDLYMFGAVGTFEYRVPIAGNLSAFSDVSAGPAYMDYSFDTPDGQHFGAKRLGADSFVEVGLRYGPVQIAAGYRGLTEPAGIDFSGAELSVTLVVVHF
jgi:hypothetical protein